ncbi:hypothetical protein [Bacillus sp. 165]|nr:hypothetical protein [Bacillus sp. 165]MBO9128508.1 hypothetical protein [Bacillus sp. 165]
MNKIFIDLKVPGYETGFITVILHHEKENGENNSVQQVLPLEIEEL